MGISDVICNRESDMMEPADDLATLLASWANPVSR